MQDPVEAREKHQFRIFKGDEEIAAYKVIGGVVQRHQDLIADAVARANAHRQVHPDPEDDEDRLFSEPLKIREALKVDRRLELKQLRLEFQLDGV